jgi:hypothetical protein
MTDTPETDLEDDLSIDCNNPCYNCPVIKESTGAHLTCDFVPAEFARRLERERDELRRLWDAECAESRKLEQAREYNAGLVAELEATLEEVLMIGNKSYEMARELLAEARESKK